MKIQEQTIEEIRRAVDIVDVISSYVKLKKRGKNYVGLCPFHTEKTPSFTVSADKQMYHCFGCSKGGNVFTFLMEIERLSFVEAVKVLGERVGIRIEPESKNQKNDTRERLYALCRMAAQWFFENMMKTKEGEYALTYCRQRGLRDEAIQAFGLGYAPNSWEAFVKYAAQKGYTNDELVGSGLARKREDGTLYDYFRGRLMIPIFSVYGHCIAFGARKLYDDDPIAGKYINSPETLIYNKSQVLYGLFQAKDVIRKEDAAFLVEGYMDLLACVQAGVSNVVASSGTALTEEQLLLLSKYTRNLTIVYDADSAGLSATVRGIDLALEHNFRVNVVVLDEGEDPDSFIRKYGAAEFRHRLRNSVSWIEYKAQQLIGNKATQSPEKKAEAIRTLIGSIAKIPDELRRNFYIKNIAETYNIYESVLYNELTKFLQTKQYYKGKLNINEEVLRAIISPDSQQVSKKPESITAEEQDLLKILLEGNSEVVQYVLEYIIWSDIENQHVRSLVKQIYSFKEIPPDERIHRLLELVKEDEKLLLSKIALSRYTVSDGWEEVDKKPEEADISVLARDVIIAFQRKQLRRKIHENVRALRQASLTGVDVRPYLERQQELLEAMKQIDSPDFIKHLRG